MLLRVHRFWRPALAMPAFHPGARPPCGGSIVSTDIPLRVTSHAITEFEFHISPIPNSSRPQITTGTDAAKLRRRCAISGSSLKRCGLATAAPTSGMTPFRQHRTSYRNGRKQASRRLNTGPSKTTPRDRVSASGLGQRVFDDETSLRYEYLKGGVI